MLIRPQFLRNCVRCLHFPVKDTPAEVEQQAQMRKRAAVEKLHHKAIRVAILGASTTTGELLAMLLKANPLISHLYLHGDAARGVAADLSSIDTRTMVTGYYENDADKAVKRAEVIVILPESKFGEAIDNPVNKFRHEYERLIKLTRIITMYAPKSVLYICVEPVSMAVPVVAAIFKKTHWYHPGRIIGSVAFHQVRLNSLLAFHNDLDPSGVHVPLVGGPDIDNLVPLFSRATPIGTTPCEARGLTVRFKNLPDHENVMFEKDKLEFADLEPSSHAYALNRAITAMALGLLGDPEADMTAFIRSNVLPTCKHIATTVRIGAGGVIHNYGIPILSEMELQLVERALLSVDEREQQALTMLEQVDERKVAIRT